MKKKLLLLLTALLLVLVGCGKTESAGDSSTTENQTETETKTETELMSEDEAIELAQNLMNRMNQMEEIILHGEGMHIDAETSFQPDWAENPFYLAHIDGYENYKSFLNDIKSIYSEEVFNSYYSFNFDSRYRLFEEHEGDIYYASDEIMAADGPMFSWNLDQATVNFITKNRISIYAPCGMYENNMEGQILLVKEDGEWKLGTMPKYQSGIPNTMTRIDYADEELSFLSVDEIIEMAGDEDNGWRMDKPISDYIVEIDPESYDIFWRSDFTPFTAVNIYEEDEQGDLHLVDKIFVMSDGADMPIYPEIDSYGIRTLDYTYLVGEGNEDTLFAYIHIPAYDQSAAENLMYEFGANEMRTTDYIQVYTSMGYEFYGIIPKYYGTGVKVEELDITGETNKPLFVLANRMKTVLAVANYSDIRPNTRVTVNYQGDEFTFEPFLSLEDGSPIDVERGDFFLYDPWDNAVG